MINPPFFGTFSKPQNSIFQKTRLTAPTTGRIISRNHCGNMLRPLVDCEPLFLAGDEPLLLKALFVGTLQLTLEWSLISSHQSGTSRSARASSFQRSQKPHSNPRYSNASAFVRPRETRWLQSAKVQRRAISNNKTSRSTWIDRFCGMTIFYNGHSLSMNSTWMRRIPSAPVLRARTAAWTVRLYC